MDAAGGHLARAVAADAAQLDRPVRGRHVDFEIVEGRDEPVTVYTTRPDTLYGATFMVVAADAQLADGDRHPEQRAAFEAYLEEVRKATDIDRLSTDRPKTGVFLGVTRSTRSTASGSRSGRPTTCWPTTAPARSWPCPRTTSATWTSPRQFDLPVRRVVDTGEDDPGAGERPPATARSTSTPGRWTA